jgi:putative transposase
MFKQSPYYFLPKRQAAINKWKLFRQLGKEQLSPQAQLKLEWIIFYHTIARRKVVPTARHFGIAPKTLHKWLKRFDEKNLLSLEEASRAPQHVRKWMVTGEEEVAIKKLRRENMMLGKRKLKVLYQETFGKQISTWKIERVIRKHELYPERRSHAWHVEKRSRNKEKVRIHKLKEKLKSVKQFSFLWHIDCVIVWWYGRRRVIITALEDTTKIAYAHCYANNTSQTAADFLRRLLIVADTKITAIHTDNGSEFAGLFQEACERLQIQQVYSRARTPKDNAALERFNRTIQEEWLEQSVIGLDELYSANQDLTEWLIHYNAQRPHQALDYKTPLQYAHDHFFKLLPMWPASTLF